MMVGDMRWFRKFVSEMMNSKFYATLLPSIRSLEKRKIYTGHSLIFVESNSTISNYQTISNAYTFLRLVVTQ